MGNHPWGNIDGGKCMGSLGSQGNHVMGGFPQAIIHPGSIDGGKCAGELSSFLVVCDYDAR